MYSMRCEMRDAGCEMRDARYSKNMSGGIFLGLGSNIGDRAAYLKDAIKLIGLPIVAMSSVYESEPVDYLNQPWFLKRVSHTLAHDRAPHRTDCLQQEEAELPGALNRQEIR